MKLLADCTAIVTGASRGAGRGVAVELGAAGATVHVTGRSTRASPAPGYERFLARAGLDAMPGTIDDVAEEVTAAGGRGIAHRCDHGDPDAVRERLAVAALAADPDVHRRTGAVLRVGELAREYGFTDVDGRRVPPFEMG